MLNISIKTLNLFNDWNEYASHYTDDRIDTANNVTFLWKVLILNNQQDRDERSQLRIETIDRFE